MSNMCEFCVRGANTLATAAVSICKSFCSSALQLVVGVIKRLGTTVVDYRYGCTPDVGKSRMLPLTLYVNNNQVLLALRFNKWPTNHNDTLWQLVAIGTAFTSFIANDRSISGCKIKGSARLLESKSHQCCGSCWQCG